MCSTQSNNTGNMIDGHVMLCDAILDHSEAEKVRGKVRLYSNMLHVKHNQLNARIQHISIRQNTNMSKMFVTLIKQTFKFLWVWKS